MAFKNFKYTKMFLVVQLKMEIFTNNSSHWRLRTLKKFTFVFLSLILLGVSFIFAYSFQIYTVKRGDTLSGIAQKLSVSANSILDLNPTINPNKLWIGQRLKIVEPDGIFQSVDKGQALWYIAAEYFTTIKNILKYNHLKNPNMIFPGEKFFIPTFIICKTSKRKTGVIWPVFGYITSPYGWRINPLTHKKEFHPGIDIGAPEGTPIFAAISGVVTYAGWDDGYGKMVQIFNGHLLTRYGHMSRIDCYTGEHVQQGELIGRIGSTGLSTGPHLHFEIRINGIPYNPLGYLPYVSWSGELPHPPTPYEEGMGY